MNNEKKLSPARRDELFALLKARFEKHTARHAGVTWNAVLTRLEASPDKAWTLSEMEKTGGEPDVIGVDKKTGEIIFCDCSPESPAQRRSFCYDRPALDARKENKPANNAEEAAAAMGAALISEDDYKDLQKLGKFDTKTSSWLKTPPEVRKLGGAIFGDRRYDRVFIYHNGADSYYAARGFRCLLKV